MTVIVVGAKDHTVAVKESVQEIADILNALVEDEHHLMLTELNGQPVLIHCDMIDLVTT